MSKIFISYRRKESADITGRLFDRLIGYFGPDSVFMDVDVLISGADYRTQIGSIIEKCDVLLAIIGQQWTSITDDAGKRRLDNPDDQLRIEIATAIERKIAVVPILVHDATLPEASELPEDLGPLAKLQPLRVQSGLPFNTDVQKLIDKMEQEHGLRHPDRRFPLELVLIPLGIILIVVGVLGALVLPRYTQYVAARIGPGSLAPMGKDTSLAGYYAEIRSMLLYCTIPLGLGPLLIVLGNRWCCVTKDSRRERLHFSSGIGRRPTPKSGKAVLSLGLGLASLGWGAIAAVPALIVAVWSFLDVRQHRGWVRGRSLAVIGIILALLGGIGTTDLQLFYWQFGHWLRDFDKADQAQVAGNLDQALADFQLAKDDMTSLPICSQLCELRIAEIYAQAGQYDTAIPHITSLIDRLAKPEEVYLMPEGDLLRQAYGARAQMYDAMGESDKANADRRRQSEVGMQPIFPPPDNTIDYYEEPPKPPGSATPPAPAVDPSA